ncbi:MAG: Flp pilus assembly protein CpaB [Pseudomonadota bacterium]
MRIVSILILCFGVALAGGAIVFASRYFAEYEASLARQNQGPETVRVLAAQKTYSYGDKLDGAQLKWVEWPAQAVPEGAFTTAEALFGEAHDEDRIVLRRIEAGELILSSKITGFGERPRMAMQLADGKRAVTIRIDAVSGVGGFVAAGDHVDIILTRTIDGRLVSNAILLEVPVIAVDQVSDNEQRGPRIGRTATVEVDAEDAQKLALAQQVGRLSFTLRSVRDVAQDGEGEIRPVSVDDLMPFEKEEAPVVVAPEPPRTVRVRKGISVEDVQIE